MARIQITGLTQKPTPIADTDLFAIDDSKADSWKVTGANLKTYINAAQKGDNSDITSLSGLSGQNAIVFSGTSVIKAPQADAKSLSISARDVDAKTDATFCLITSANTPTMAFVQPAGGLLTWDGGPIGSVTPAAGNFTTVLFDELLTKNINGASYTFKAWDVDGLLSKTFLTATSANVPTFAFSQPSGGLLSWDGGIIGATTPAAGSFTSLTLSNTGSINSAPTTSSFYLNIWDTDGGGLYRTFITANAQAIPLLDISAPTGGEIALNATRASSQETFYQKRVTANTGAAYSMDAVNGTFFDLTLDSNCTITAASSAVSSTQVQFSAARITQDGTGGRTLSWAGVTWASGVAPAMPTAIGASIYLSFQTLNGVVIGYALLQASDSLTLAAMTLTTGLVGITSGSAVGAGYVGEIISSTIAIGSAISLTTGTAKTITSITLSAGKWDIWGNNGFIAAAGTLPTILEGSISTTTNTQATSPNNGAYFRHQLTFTAASTNIFPVGFITVNINTPTTYYLVGTATFTVSTLTVYGALFAERR